MKGGRRPEPRIVDIATHRREEVGLRVAAHFLGMSERSLRKRIESGQLDAMVDGRIYKIRTDVLRAYDNQRRALCSTNN